MDKKNNQSKTQNASSSRHLPLVEQMTDEQISDVMAHLSFLKQQKQDGDNPQQTDSGQGDLPSEKTHSIPENASDDDDSAQIFPDPACFEDLGDEPLPKETQKDLSAQTPLRTAQQDETDAIPPSRPLPTDDMDEETIALYRNLILKRRRQKRLLYTLIATVGVLILMIALFVGYLTMYKPQVDNKPPSFWNPSGENSENQTGNDPLSDDENVQAPVISDSFTRREDVYNFLILGIDRAANLSDVIMIVSYDVKNGDINVLSLPRDTYINVGSNYHKLNAYFSASYNHSRAQGKERYREAIESMAEFLENGLCIRLDRYICMDTAGFRDIVNAVGGVDMEVPMDMDYEDPEQDLYIHLKAGYQHLDGELAEQFVRFRSGYLNGDIGRISAQKLFLTALAGQLKKNFNVSTLIAIAKTCLTYVTTDLTAPEIGYFVKYALAVDMEKIRFTTLPGGGVVNPVSGASYYVMYAENVRRLVNAYFNVYTKEISREVFLLNAAKFTSSESYIASVFATEINDAGTVSAKDIENDTINIPAK